MSAKVRINRYDNLKGLAMFFIVLGHMTFLSKYTSVSIIHNFLCIIHLPIFFFVAGYFSKIGPNEPIKAFKRLLIPFIIFCIVWDLFNIFVRGIHHNDALFINTGFGLWFLISLFTMKLLLPILDKFKHPILITFIVAILTGFLDADKLGISRTLSFLPIFLIGFYYDDWKNSLSENISSLLEKDYVIYISFILTIICCLIAAYYIPGKMILLKSQFDTFDLTSVILRIIVLLLGIINTLLLNRVMTNKETVLTKVGRNSLAVFILHVYIVSYSIPIMRPIFMHHPNKFLLATFIVSVIMTYILSRDFFTKWLNKLTDGVFDLICKAI